MEESVAHHGFTVQSGLTRLYYCLLSSSFNIGMYQTQPVVNISLKSSDFVSVSIFSLYSYEILAASAIPKGFMDGKQACGLMVRKWSHFQTLASGNVSYQVYKNILSSLEFYQDETPSTKIETKLVPTLQHTKLNSPFLTFLSCPISVD